MLDSESVSRMVRFFGTNFVADHRLYDLIISTVLSDFRFHAASSARIE
jgi:hypothetical protein